jgi:hypothetical protein
MESSASKQDAHVDGRLEFEILMLHRIAMTTTQKHFIIKESY